MLKMTRKKERRAGGGRRSGDSGGRAGLRGYLGLAMGLALAGALGAGVVLGLPRAQRELAERLAGQPVVVAIEWPVSGGGAGGESWLPREVRDEVSALAQRALEREGDPFSASGLKAVAEAIQGTGWVSSVVRVERRGTGEVRVRAAWHTPAAVVRLEGLDYLVGLGGEILPMRYRRDTSPLRVVIGARKLPPMQGGRPVPGQVWPGEDVRAGLELLGVVASRRWADQVTGVDVSEYLAGPPGASRRELTLLTSSNARIVWGGGPADTIPGQLATPVKLARLDALFSRHGRIDAGKRLVDVTGVYTMVEDTATANAQ
jgi:hypothetical protein